MTLKAIWELIVGLKDEISIGTVILIVFLSLVQVSKIEWNPWDHILGWFGKKLNKNIQDKVDTIETKLDNHIKEDEVEKLETKRRDILAFANSCMNGHKHTQEQFTFVLKKCDEYEVYIEKNKIKNGEISSAIEEIRRLNQKCRQNNSYLKPGEEID